MTQAPAQVQLVTSTARKLCDFLPQSFFLFVNLTSSPLDNLAVHPPSPSIWCILQESTLPNFTRYLLLRPDRLQQSHEHLTNISRTCRTLRSLPWLLLPPSMLLSNDLSRLFKPLRHQILMPDSRCHLPLRSPEYHLPVPSHNQIRHT